MALTNSQRLEHQVHGSLEGYKKVLNNVSDFVMLFIGFGEVYIAANSASIIQDGVKFSIYLLEEDI